MFRDEAYVHCAIALSIMVLNKLITQQEDHFMALAHLVQTLRLMNKRLSSKEEVSDFTIAVVVIMAQYERLQGQYDQGLVHLEGLRKMVELRGGIAHLTRNKPSLTPKIFRVDLDYALYLGSPTLFSVEDLVAGSSAMAGLCSSSVRQQNRRRLNTLHTRLFQKIGFELQNLLIDMTAFSWLLNDANAGDQPKLNSFTFHEALLSFGYRVVHFSPLGGPRPSSRLENSIHLGLAGFIISFLRGLDRKIAHIPRLAELARSAAQEPSDDNREDQEVLLWLLLLGEASIFKQPDDASWLVSNTAHTMLALGLRDWDDVTRTLSKFPWVHAVHNKVG